MTDCQLAFFSMCGKQVDSQGFTPPNFYTCVRVVIYLAVENKTKNHPKLIRDSHYMVLPQTFLYRFSTMHKFQILLKFKLFWCYKSFVLVRLPWLDYMSPILLNMNLIWTASGKWHSTSRSFFIQHNWSHDVVILRIRFAASEQEDKTYQGGDILLSGCRLCNHKLFL